MVTNFQRINNIKFFIHWETEQQLHFRAICNFPKKNKKIEFVINDKQNYSTILFMRSMQKICIPYYFSHILMY